MKRAYETRYAIAREVLTYAMMVGVISISMLAVGLFTIAKLPLIPSVVTTAVTGFIWVLGVTPHLVAHWIDIPVDHLLGLTKSNRSSTQKEI